MSVLSIFIKNVITACVVFLVLASCFAWYYQHDLLHHPTRYSLDEMKSKYIESSIKVWPDDFNYKGLLAEPAQKEENTAGTVVLFHGNAGSASDRLWYAKDLTDLGFRVILHEYTGYGAKSGSLNEEEITNDALSTVTHAKSRYRGKVFLIGESLGAAVAASVASKTQVDGVLLISPWDSLQSTAKDLYWYLPTELLLREKYNSAQSLKEYTGPLAVVIAEKDELIKPVFSQNLYDTFIGPKKVWYSPNATHNTWKSLATPVFWRDVFHFLNTAKGK